MVAEFMSKDQKVCIIDYRKLSYRLLVDGKSISFSGSDIADYFEEHYRKCGYEVIRTGTGE